MSTEKDETPISQRVKQSGQRLREAQDALGIPSKMVEEMCGIPHSTYANWRIGNRPIDPFRIEPFCKYSGITADYIFFGDKARLPYDLIQKLEELDL
ncbi:helix-turn-helix transcriptional regulator [Nisaea sp.]|uniref:helix-turn-helix domain-containing protein n=1 Tax=Nisaea sp. TaxID=2024842 RepID=UPI003296CBA2